MDGGGLFDMGQSLMGLSALLNPDQEQKDHDEYVSRSPGPIAPFCHVVVVGR